MSEFRAGDRHILIAGGRTRLRFTVSALAEIANFMQADSPAGLARKLRGAGAGEWNLILQALAEPRPQNPLNEDEMAKILPSLSAVIASGFTP
jgi:hypothetical protein